MILIVDMNFRKGSLGYYEFVLPIAYAVRNVEDYIVKHHSELKQENLTKYSCIILSGTPLKDHATLNEPEKFAWVKDCEVPILGICAGMQTIALAFVLRLKKCLGIGMTEITTTASNPLFSSTFKAYALHNFSVIPSPKFTVLAKSGKCVQAIKHKQKNIFGVLFHPEVRNEEIIHRFIRAFAVTE
jgi:GMP synthase-like glutamine amidotransferase